MNALQYLFFTKIKATIRNIYSKPVSAILTTMAMLFFGWLIYMGITSRPATLADQVATLETAIMGLLGYLVLLFALMLFQNQTTLVQLNDAYFIFVGPFTRKQILGYLMVETMKGSALYAGFTMLYMFLFVSNLKLSFGYLLFMTTMVLLLLFLMFSFITFFYLLSITNDHTKTYKRLTLVGIVVVLLLLTGKNIIANNFQFIDGFQAFLHDPMFNFLPFFGWVKWTLMGAANQNMIEAMTGFGLLLICCIAITIANFHVKGDFYERAMTDASWYQDLRKGMKEGKTTSLNQKIKAVDSVKFLDGAKAIYSKNLLELRKTKNWIRKQDIFLMAFYMLIAKLMKMDFTFYQYYILIVLMMSVNQDVLVSELKRPFIYLIPETPMKKLMYLILPSCFRLFLLILCALVPALIVFQANAIQLIAGIIELTGYCLLFVGANVWSLKVLKSRSNVFAEQMIKMAVVVIASVPSFALTIAIFSYLAKTPVLANVLVMLSSFSINVLVAGIFLWNAKSMLRGANLMAD